MPLWAPREEDQMQATPKPVAAAAHPSPESFTLMTWVIQTLQSTEPEHAAHKEVLLQQCATTVALKILGRLTLPHNTTDLMAPFANVRSLSIYRVYLDDLPLLPCTEKLESLALTQCVFQAIQNIAHYTNLHTLQIAKMSHSVTEQDPNPTHRLAVLTQLHTAHIRLLHHVNLRGPRPRSEGAFEPHFKKQS